MMNISGGNPYSGFNLTQSTREKTNISTSAPSTDNVLDLTQKKNIKSELTSQTAENTQFIRVKDNAGEDLFLSLERLSPEQVSTLVDDLKNQALNKGGELKGNFQFDDFVQVTGQDIQIGNKTQQTNPYLEKAPIERAQSVVTHSNANNQGEVTDQTWSFANGTSNSLAFQNPSDKPAPWNNHLFYSGEKAFIYQTTSDTRNASLPNEKTLELNLDQAKEMGLPKELLEEVKNTGKLRYLDKSNYQTMLKSDFNFNAAFNEFQSSDQFHDALKNTYPERLTALGENNFKALSDRIYSYAQSAQDTNGAIDIESMQGLLYALDPEIRMSSNSNTPMKAQDLFGISQDQFKGLSRAEQENYVPSKDGSYVPLSISKEQFNTLDAGPKDKFIALGDRYIPKGDNKHGRATILTTRHIMENIKHAEVPTAPMDLHFDTGVSSLFSDKDRFVRDASGSMDAKWNIVMPGINQTLHDQGVLKDGENLEDKLDMTIEQQGYTQFNTRASDYNNGAKIEGRSETYGEANKEMADFSNVLAESYTSLYPDNTESNRLEIAQLLGTQPELIFNDSGKLDGDKLMKTIGDSTSKSKRISHGHRREFDTRTANMGATGEAAMKGAITALLLDPDYQNNDGTRMNIMLDEPLQDLEYLKLAQTLAKAKGVEVRFISMPTGLTDSTTGSSAHYANKDDFKKNPEQYMVFVDLESISVNQRGGTPSSLEFTATKIQADGSMASTQETHDIQYFDRQVHGDKVDFGENKEGFKGAFVPLLYNETGEARNKIYAGTE